MKYMIAVLSLGMILFMTACGEKIMKADGYQHISQQQAKEMMDQQTVILLDVREQEEYEAGHITNAVLLPVSRIDQSSADAVIPRKDAVVLVYCRSGNRSKKASQMLVELGYTQVYEFGGINTWSYGLESSNRTN